jgi:hypothetical protein
MAEVKKIIIDEDWKSQVQAEKEEAAKATSPSTTAADKEAEPAEAGDPQMPPASFELLVTSLATEALMALGQMPHPVTGKAQAQRNLAKYLIDTLEMLREKTKGNLPPNEQQMIESVVHQMRLLFVETASEPAKK